mgnify:CR=1 FL=1
MDEKQLSEAISLLRRRTTRKQLEVIHAHYVWTAGFEWREGASVEDIVQLEETLHRKLPADYAMFLLESNGAVLYKDVKYGQWGFYLYGTHELAAKNQQWSESLRGRWSNTFIAFAETFGDANALIFDTNQPTLDGTSFAVLEATAYEPAEDWPRASRSFQEWFQHLITAQGDKFWTWH